MSHSAIWPFQFSLGYSTLSTVSEKEFEKEEKTNHRLSATNPRYKIKNKKICYFSWQLIILYLNAVLLLACKSRSLSAWNGNSLIIFLMILMLCKIINYQVEFFWFLEVCTKDFKVIIQVKRKYDRFVFISFSCWLVVCL